MLRRAACPIVLCAALLPAPAALGFMDNGGRISRDLAVGDDAENGIEMLYAAWQGGGGKQYDVTLFAFCAAGGPCPAMPEQVTPCTITQGGDEEPTEIKAVACDADADSPCRWKAVLHQSRGDISYSPPSVSKDGARVVVATRDQGYSHTDGRIFAFDPAGHCRWVYEPEDGEAQNGFYSRPTVHEVTAGALVEGSFVPGEYLVLATNKKTGHLHALRDTGTLGDGLTGRVVTTGHVDVAAEKIGDGGEIYFQPIVDTECGDCGGQPSCTPLLRTYVGLHAGSSKRGLYGLDLLQTSSAGLAIQEAWRFLEDDLDDITSLPPAFVGRTLGYRLGGVLVDTGSTRYVVAAMRSGDGVTAVEIPDQCADPRDDDQLIVEWGQDDVGTFVKEVHRTRPTHVWEPVDTCHDCPNGSCPTGCVPAVFVGQKQGYTGNTAAVHRFEPTPTQALPHSWSWARCDGTGHTVKHTSWASPVVNEKGDGDVFIGTNQDTGIHRVRTGLLSGSRTDYDQCPAQDLPEWFPYRPSGGWRTTAAYSASGQTLHMGGSYRVMHTLDATYEPDDGEGGTVDPATALLWCYDMEAGAGAVCPGRGQGDASPEQACCEDVYGGLSWP